MANATQRVASEATPYAEDKVIRGLASAAQTYYPGAMIARATTGYHTKCDDTAGLAFDGINAEAQDKTVFSGDSAAARQIHVQRPRYFTMAIASAAAGDEGKRLYAAYDNEVGYTSTHLVFVGWVDKVLSSTSVLVKAAYVGDDPAAPNFQTIGANGAVTQKSGTLVVTKAGVCAMTIADPTSGTDDGKRLTVISATASAHTLSNAAGSGFNGGGASSDVGTFGGAKGDGITLVAYQGVWYVEDKTNVTLA